MSQTKEKDLIIVGLSAAGITAAIYAARRGLNFTIIGKDVGGEVATSGEIGNWPGIIETDGVKLAMQFKEHLDSYKPEIYEGLKVESISRRDDGRFDVGCSDGAIFIAKAVIVATGVHPRKLGIPGEDQFHAKGVSSCTVCDGPVFKGKTTVTIGGGNSALESALFLSDICPKTYVINKNPQFKGEKVLVDNLLKKTNVEIIYNAMTTEITGDEFVRAVKYKDQAGQEHELKVEGAFVHIGQVPNSTMMPADVAKNDFGEIKVNARCETSLPGIFAAGDVTDVPYKQIVIACGQGSIAALSAVQYLNRLH